MSEQQVGKKMVEETDFNYFAEAYEHVTGRSLTIHRAGERPDFICTTQHGWRLGVELTLVPQADRVVLFDPLWTAADAKAEKKRRGDWALPNRTILVLQVDVPLSELKHRLERVVRSDYELGFMEIWVADYSDLDAFGTVELFGLRPARWFGYHRRSNWQSKPYG